MNLLICLSALVAVVNVRVTVVVVVLVNVVAVVVVVVWGRLSTPLPHSWQMNEMNAYLWHYISRPSICYLHLSPPLETHFDYILIWQIDLYLARLMKTNAFWIERARYQ